MCLLFPKEMLKNMLILLITLLVVVLIEGINFSIRIKKGEVPENIKKWYIMIVFIDFSILALVSVLFYFNYKAITSNSFITFSRFIVPILIIIRLISHVGLTAKKSK